MKRNEDSLRDLWDNIQCTNIAVSKEERQKGSEKIFEKIAENFLNMRKEIKSIKSRKCRESQEG